MTKKFILVHCRDCGATGLYQGFAEPKGHAVICITCNGTGAEKISYSPFKKRKQKQGIEYVCISVGKSLITGVGGVRKKIPYAEFLKLKKYKK